MRRNIRLVMHNCPHGQTVEIAHVTEAERAALEWSFHRTTLRADGVSIYQRMRPDDLPA
jgi:hypothetical protein